MDEFQAVNVSRRKFAFHWEEPLAGVHLLAARDFGRIAGSSACQYIDATFNCIVFEIFIFR
ncbi:hypothetical protein [Stappia indica]|uniref:hypothetical protein n=1 Tax=Stappia indica TaxID=538381 RepID=UPI001D17EE20|nr:hypothetical protein [Stappia indica]MCC4245749.1 hypothetical protein [Stappia indica]